MYELYYFYYIIFVFVGFTLHHVLSFFTGGDTVPLIGYDAKPSLSFSRSNVLPIASTCALYLTHPTRYFDDPIMFKAKMIFGLMNHGGFRLH